MSNYLINVEKFFIIKPMQFDYILTQFNISYTNNISYFIGLIVINFFAYIVIYFIYRLIKTLFNYFFRKITLFRWLS